MGIVEVNRKREYNHSDFRKLLGIPDEEVVVSVVVRDEFIIVETRECSAAASDGRRLGYGPRGGLFA